MNVSDFILYACFPEARLDLSAEDNVIALALAGYPARPYAEFIRSDIPGPSNLRSAHSSASRSSPAATLGSSPIGLTAANPTRGEILVHLGAASRKPRSVKRKKPSSTEEDRPVSAKVQKLGASPTAREPERASSPLAESPMILSPPISPKLDRGAKSPFECDRQAVVDGYAYNRLESAFGKSQIASSKGGKAEEKETESKSR